jgi:hypothetical protein
MTRAVTYDTAAIGLSSLCMVHCLALPVVAASLPLAAAWSEAEWVHWLFVALAAPVSILALVRGSSSGVPWASVALAALGLAGLVAGVGGWPAHEAETLMTVMGSGLLAAAHILNWWRLRHQH